MSEGGDVTQALTPHVADSENTEEEDFYGSESEEVVLKTPQDPITRKDIRGLINCWEENSRKSQKGCAHLRLACTMSIHIWTW